MRARPQLVVSDGAPVVPSHQLAILCAAAWLVAVVTRSRGDDGGLLVLRGSG